MITRILHKINKGVDSVYLLIASLLFIIMIVSSAIQVFTRYVLNSSMVGTEELARYCFIWMSLLGGAVAVGKWAHTSISVVYDALPGKAKKIAFIFQNLCILALCVVFMKGGFTMIKATAMQSTPTLHIPKWIIYLAVPVSGFGMGLHAIEWIIRTVGEMTGKNYADLDTAESAGKEEEKEA